MKFEVFNEVFFKKEGLEKTLQKLFPEKKEMLVNIVFVSEDEIKRLNSEFRKKNEVTDVLSFKLDDKISEVYICPDYVLKNNEDIARMIIHGILHILGYIHKGYFSSKEVNEEMFEIQERKLTEFYDILKK